MGTTTRYRASKREIHLSIGWRWLVWDDVESWYVGWNLPGGALLGYASREQAAQAADALNEKEARKAS